MCKPSCYNGVFYKENPNEILHKYRHAIAENAIILMLADTMVLFKWLSPHRFCGLMDKTDT